MRHCHMMVTLTCLLLLPARWAAAEEPGITVDVEKQSISIPAKIAPRKLPHLPDIYPIEVIACFAHPKGQKAHETVVTIDAAPSAVHKALAELGLEPGKPAKGEGAQATGPALKVLLELPGPGGVKRRLPIERALVDNKTGKTMPTLKWHFTGSAEKQPDPDKPDKVYGADLTGTLIAVFPVTDETVVQSHLTMKEEPLLKMDTNKQVLPAEGTEVRLVIEVVK